MSAIDEGHTFTVPEKQIRGQADMDKWLKSVAYQELIGFLECLNEAVRGKSISANINPSKTLLAVVSLLDQLDKIIDETPPIDQPQRFGNKGFAQFYEKLRGQVDTLLESLLEEKYHKSIPEISVYLVESVGNSTRIDYGTGHELAFVMFMYCLFRIGALDSNSSDDKIGAVTLLFSRYMTLVRKLQVTYRMEPAGSHGVWSLDDFQFVPFIWGSSQFVGNPVIEPSSFTESETVNRLAPENLFLGAIQYILQVKSGPFHEHSNQLWNISGTQSWTKINQGLIKMYKAEVLSKFPVVQHVLFGSLLSIETFDPNKKAFGKSTGSLSLGMKGMSLPPKFTSPTSPQ